MIDDSDLLSRQMLDDQIDRMWAESIWHFMGKEETKRRLIWRKVEREGR